MGHWNYRMTVKHHITPNLEFDAYSIREIYYEEDGNLIGWTDPVELAGESPHEVLRDIEIMAVVSEHPILNLDTKEWQEWPKEEELEPADEEG